MEKLQAHIHSLLQGIYDKKAQISSGRLGTLRPYAAYVGLALVALIALSAYLLESKNVPDNRVQGLSVQTSSASPSAAPINQSIQLKVDVSGAVHAPGVKILKEGDRVEDALRESGGFTDKADPAYVAMSINLAAKLQDGDKIFIPEKGQAQAEVSVSASASSSSSTSKPTSSTATGGKVSINRGTAAQLDSLPGIGETYTQRIIAGRPYASVDDLCSRTGIFRSKSTCQDIRPLITL